MIVATVISKKNLFAVYQKSMNLFANRYSIIPPDCVFY